MASEEDSPETRRERALVELEALHREVDERARALARRHAGRLRCGRGCADCCCDDIRVLDVEAERIRARHAALLRDGTPHPRGACAFLDEERACRIYPDRPYVCRTQGLPLRWFDPERPTQAGAPVPELRDICPLNDAGGPALEELAEEDCWLLGPNEERLRTIAERFSGGAAERIALRGLFARRAPSMASRSDPGTA